MREIHADDEPILKLNLEDEEEPDVELADGAAEARIIHMTEFPMEETPFKMLLEMRGVGADESRLGVDLVTILDISSRMRGFQIAKMKLAMKFLIHKLSQTDRLSVVTFNKEAYKLCPLRQISEYSRKEIANQVNALVAMYSTNIESGLQLALEILIDRTSNENRSVAVMLMSSGLEDSVHSNSASLQLGDVPVFTFGFGSDCEPKALNAIAHNSQGGIYTTVADQDSFSVAFSKPLASLLNVSLDDLTVTIKPLIKGLKITEINAENYQQTKDTEVSPATSVTIGPLYYRETRRVYVKGILAKTDRSGGVHAVQISFKYRDVEEDTHGEDYTVLSCSRQKNYNAEQKGFDEELRQVTKSLILNNPQEGDQTITESYDDQMCQLYKSSLHGKQPEEEAQVIEEDDRARGCEFIGYSPLWSAVKVGDWVKAYDFLKDHQTDIESNFKEREPGREISILTKTALHEDQLEFAKEILKLAPPESLEFREEVTGYTILHMLAMWGNIETVKLVVKKNPKLTQIRDIHKNLPLSCAVQTSDGENKLLEYLYNKTKDEDPSPFRDAKGDALVKVLVQANLHGIALSILQRVPTLLTDRKISRLDLLILELIVLRPFAFQSGHDPVWWESWIYSIIEVDSHGYDYDIKEGEGTKTDEKINPPEVVKNDLENPPDTSAYCSSTRKGSTMIWSILVFFFIRCLMLVPRFKKFRNQKRMHEQAVALVTHVLANLYKTMDRAEIIDYFRNSSILKTAIQYGTTEFVLECLHKFPFLASDDKVGERLIAMVVEERNEKIFNLICNERAKTKSNTIAMFDNNGNSILHLAARVAPNRQLNSVSGAALQMQREIQWFKGVEKMMLQRNRFARNEKGETAQFLFTEKHKNLIARGERWMKDTSGSCMLVAALIATVAFATAFTVPGGNVSDSSSSSNGNPVFLNNNSFVVFVVADALALFSSITSVLMFLAVFTSRYSEEDFLKSLPQKLIIGLATLFISMATVLIAFGAAFTIVLGDRFPWAPIPVSLFACVPVLLFIFMQLPLFVEMVHHTYWPIRFGKENQRHSMKQNYIEKQKHK